VTARILFDFGSPEQAALWSPVDDVVMGGISRSAFNLAEPGTAEFSGAVSLDFGGGFASVRTRAQAWPTAGAKAFVLRVLGDGKTYKFTVRTDDGYDGIQYQSRLTPPAGEWADVVLPSAGFVASFRGRPVRGAPPLDMSRVRALGLMIADRQAGPFELRVARIAVIADAAD
jgi:hypothetical protein